MRYIYIVVDSSVAGDEIRLAPVTNDNLPTVDTSFTKHQVEGNEMMKMMAMINSKSDTLSKSRTMRLEANTEKGR